MARIDDLEPPAENHGPAWYPDPLGSTNRERYWDGSKWTSMTRTGGMAPNMAQAPGPVRAAAPEGEAPVGWYPDPHGATNRERYWDGQKWTANARTSGPRPKATVKTWLAGGTIALLGIGALALGLFLGFFVAFDKSSPDFRENAVSDARRDASIHYEQTTTITETQTRQITTARPSDATP